MPSWPGCPVVLSVLARKARWRSLPWPRRSWLRARPRSLRSPRKRVGWTRSLRGPPPHWLGGSSVTTFLAHLPSSCGLGLYDVDTCRRVARRRREASDRPPTEAVRAASRPAPRSCAVCPGDRPPAAQLPAIGTFDAARQVATTVLASAGVISVIFGLSCPADPRKRFRRTAVPGLHRRDPRGDVVIASDKQRPAPSRRSRLSYVVVRAFGTSAVSSSPCRYFTHSSRIRTPRCRPAGARSS